MLEILFAVYNRARGHHFKNRKLAFLTSKYIIACIASLLLFTITPVGPINAAIVVFVLLAYTIDGWGDTFLAIHGGEKEFGHVIYEAVNKKPWISNPSIWIFEKMYGTKLPKAGREGRIYGVILGTFRGLYGTLPLIFAAAYYQEPLIALYGLLFALHGSVYYISGLITKKHAIELAEILMGCVIGFIIKKTLYFYSPFAILFANGSWRKVL